MSGQEWILLDGLCESDFDPASVLGESVLSLQMEGFSASFVLCFGGDWTPCLREIIDLVLSELTVEGDRDACSPSSSSRMTPNPPLSPTSLSDNSVSCAVGWDSPGLGFSRLPDLVGGG